MKRLWLFLMMTGLVMAAFSQKNEAGDKANSEIYSVTGAGGILSAWAWATFSVIDSYDGYFMLCSKTPTIENGILKNSIVTGLSFQYNNPVNVIYSLYTFKKTFAQDGKRNYLQGINESGLVNPLQTQADIDNALDKIYEFPVVTEPASGNRNFEWDGYTDSKFTGQKYPVRDCLYFVAKDANSGAVLGMYGASALQSYRTHSDVNYMINDKTVSAEIYIPNEQSFKRIYAMLMTETCGFGATTYSIINQGTPAIAADINRRIPGDVIAYKKLENPQTIITADGYPINIYQWKDITLGINPGNGTHFIPSKPEPATGMAPVEWGYNLVIVLETDNMTYTGINDGYIDDGSCKYIAPPSNPDPNDINHAQSDFTGIRFVNVSKPDIKIYSDGSGFVVDCPAGGCATKYRIFDINGKALESGNVVSRKIETDIQLNKGNLYIVQVDTNNSTVTQKVIIK